MRNLIKAGLVALVLCLAAPVAAGPFEDGVAAAERGDFATALQLWQPLANQGDPRARQSLGNMYANGQGVPQDDAEAVKWFRKAADQGDPGARYNLGVTYQQGQGLPQDYAEAIKWYRRAADQDHASAQTNLGYMYAEGQGVAQDYVSAHMWFSVSSAQGNQTAAKNRDNVARRMTPMQIAEAQRLAREWKPTTQLPR
jgi:TPR repeat protein